MSALFSSAKSFSISLVFDKVIGVRRFRPPENVTEPEPLIDVIEQPDGDLVVALTR